MPLLYSTSDTGREETEIGKEIGKERGGRGREGERKRERQRERSKGLLNRREVSVCPSQCWSKSLLIVHRSARSQCRSKSLLITLPIWSFPATHWKKTDMLCMLLCLGVLCLSALHFCTAPSCVTGLEEIVSFLRLLSSSPLVRTSTCRWSLT